MTDTMAHMGVAHECATPNNILRGKGTRHERGT